MPDPSRAPAGAASLAALAARAERLLDGGDAATAATVLAETLPLAEAALADADAVDPDGDLGQGFLRAQIAAARVLVTGGLADVALTRLGALARDFGLTRGWRRLEAAIEAAARATGTPLDDVAAELCTAGAYTPGALVRASWAALHRDAVADAVAWAVVAVGVAPSSLLAETGREDAEEDGFLAHGGFVDLVDTLLDADPGDDAVAHTRLGLLPDVLGAEVGPPPTGAADLAAEIAAYGLSSEAATALAGFATAALPAFEAAFRKEHGAAVRGLPQGERALSVIGGARARRRLAVVAKMVALRELAHGPAAAGDRWLARFLALNRPGARGVALRLFVAQGDTTPEELAFDGDGDAALLAALGEEVLSAPPPSGRSGSAPARPRGREAGPGRAAGARARDTRRGPPRRGRGTRSSARDEARGAGRRGRSTRR